ncbi:butyrophilin subfamily 1 member A1-like [Lepus europaeus]|uniref:butyrophilin subfamily 1 member A1-like n=1 Tax=Lepus europaeus TaxID=9983 RepID=UPI002B46AFEC|nr:butyrophilin subfamily 1 member A1-like [Lepus europaeus]
MGRVNVTLDADTAHPALFLSEQRRVTWQEEKKDLPASPQRFDSLPCVLGQLSITSGRYYWEVDIGDTVSCDLGICRDNVTRNGRVTISPQNGFWAIRIYEGDFWALTSPETHLTMRESPRRVGIFLDYEDGDVSFYNMTDGSHIYTFTRILFQEGLQEDIDRRKAQYKSDWRKAALYADWRKEEFQAVHMTMDADTAHPALFLSEQRRVTWQEEKQDLPASPQRFDSLPCVLGQLSITSGRYFWEVDIGDTVSCDLGICRDNVTRKGRVTISPQNGFWAIRIYEGEYWALTSPETHLTLRESPSRVGIFLDYEDGDVSFYNMKDGSHIISFTQETFQGVLRPLFRLWNSDSGTLTIVH